MNSKTIAIVFRDNTCVILTDPNEVERYKGRADVAEIHTWEENPRVTQEKFFAFLRNVIRQETLTKN